MTLEAIYFASQVIAAFALIASLLFVGVQLRLSRKMERATAQREILQRVSDWVRMVYRNDDQSFDTFVLGMADYDGSPPLVRMHIDKCLSEFVFICESALNMRKDGFFSDGTWHGIEGNTLGMLLSRGGAQWWKYGRRYIGSEIVEHLDARLAEIRAGAELGIEGAPTIDDRLAELIAMGRTGGKTPLSGLPRAPESQEDAHVSDDHAPGASQ